MTGFDTIVVGGGSAGCVLAARLTDEPGRQVLLLEAGPDHRADDLPDALRLLSQPVEWPYEWGDHVESGNGRTHDYRRGRGIGGSSSTNGGVAIRPEPRLRPLASGLAVGGPAALFERGRARPRVR